MIILNIIFMFVIFALFVFIAVRKFNENPYFLTYPVDSCEIVGDDYSYTYPDRHQYRHDTILRPMMFTWHDKDGVEHSVRQSAVLVDVRSKLLVKNTVTFPDSIDLESLRYGVCVGDGIFKALVVIQAWDADVKFLPVAT